MAAMAKRLPGVVDIGANLLDEMFCGIYREKQLHAGDLAHVLSRAKIAGCRNVICTAGSLSESQRALELVRSTNNNSNSDGFLRCTVGVHPTQAADIAPEAEAGVFQDLLAVCVDGMRDGSVVAVGECGLDRDRVSFAPFDVQQRIWERHFALCEATKLPMFIHSRASFEDTYEVLQRHPTVRGVVHSFDHESEHDAARLLALNPGLYIGLNGCSLRTEANLQVVRSLPLDRVLVESDAPWCRIGGTSAAAKHLIDSSLPFAQVSKPEKLKGREHEGTVMVKSRNEPANTVDVLRVIAAVKQLPVSQVADQILINTRKLFGQDLGGGGGDE